MQNLNIILSTCSCRKLNTLSVVLMHKNKYDISMQLIPLYGKKLFQDYELILKQKNVLLSKKCRLEKFFLSFSSLTKCKLQKISLVVIF